MQRRDKCRAAFEIALTPAEIRQFFLCIRSATPVERRNVCRIGISASGSFGTGIWRAQTLSQCGCGRPGTGSRHHAAGAALSGDERATSQTCGADPARRLDRARIVVIPTTDADVSQAASWSSAKAPLRACSRPATRVLAMTTRQRSALGGSSPSMGGRSADSGVSSGKAARR
jgi:hypothetical protein